MVVACPTASFGLPEATVGLYAAAGGLPRIVRNCGLQIGSEVAMTGRRLTAQEALGFHLINKVSATTDSVVEETVEMAKKVAGLSPDAIIVTRHGLREAWETGSVERATQRYDMFTKSTFANVFGGSGFSLERLTPGSVLIQC